MREREFEVTTLSGGVVSTTAEFSEAPFGQRDSKDSGTGSAGVPGAPPSPAAGSPTQTTTILTLEREETPSTTPDFGWKDADPAATPFVPDFNPPETPGSVCKLGQTPAWQFVKCKAKAFARKAKQAQGDASKWIKEKSECLAKISKGAGHAIEQTRRCLMGIQLRSRDFDEQLKACFTGGDNRPENREWNEGLVCFTGLNGKTVGM
ncbi:uncharacterized protein LOC100905786 [Galendromus occidentalis]|uniref:Uncharacterized protein LOC100905786 n=1 Tax=Galendromus occidentalis TaxID=34638 RepID=A0AAJ6QWG6_9ACAR|nr:uncharacterized protein LOC100905786 [Galendromus occidentalis]